MQINVWKAAAAIGVLAINVSGMSSIAKLVEQSRARFEGGTSHCSSSLRRMTGMSSAEVPPMQGVTLADWTQQDPSQPIAAAQAALAQANASLAQENQTMHLQDLMDKVRVLSDDDDETGWLGVDSREVTADRAKELKLTSERGVYVDSVQSGSPAEKAGLKQGDVILNYDQQTVEGTVQFRRLVEETPPGRTVNLKIWRGGREQDVAVQVGKRDDALESRDFQWSSPMPRAMVAPKFHFAFPRGLDFGGPRLGISAQDLNGQLGSYFNAPDGKGVLVVEVLPGTPAEKAGLKSGDVITQVSGKAVTSTDQLRERLDDSQDAKAADVALTVLRRGTSMTLHVKMPPPQENEGTDIIQQVEL